ncbi:cytochrome P450 6a2 isoform X2 [Xylocopa sonorina]|uniref:cytochrome P450 6a2 isoform X2 n=1 Tax=Xylocopa sonorina TaxID=1818115 RepID=UPI00403ADD9D
MCLILGIIYGAIAVVVAFYYYLTARNNFWKKLKVPGPKPELAFGNIRKVMFGQESLADFLTGIWNEYKNEPFVGIFLRRDPALIIQDPDLIKDVLIKDFSTFVDREFLAIDPADPLSDHLFVLKEKKWRPLRTQLSPVFTSGKLRGTFRLILQCSNQLESYLDKLVEKNEPVEVREVAAKFTTDVIGSCAFGLEMNSLSDMESDFRRIGRQIFATDIIKVIRIRMKQIVPWLNTLITRIVGPSEVTSMIMKITRETIEYRKKHNIVRPDFMNILLELKKHPERLGDIELTDGLLAAQAFAFFAAGFETSSTAISNVLYELAFNHEVQDKLRAEIKEFEEENCGEWKYETIKQMKYLNKVFQETLRKYPGLPVLSRKAIDNYTFAGTKLTIPRGTLVWIPVYPIHMDPTTYPDPHKFDPERFSDEKVDVSRSIKRKLD